MIQRIIFYYLSFNINMYYYIHYYLKLDKNNFKDILLNIVITKHINKFMLMYNQLHIIFQLIILHINNHLNSFLYNILILHIYNTYINYHILYQFHQLVEHNRHYIILHINLIKYIHMFLLVNNFLHNIFFMSILYMVSLENNHMYKFYVLLILLHN